MEEFKLEAVPRRTWDYSLHCIWSDCSAEILL